MSESVKYEVGVGDGQYKTVEAEAWKVNETGFLVFVENNINIATFNPRFWIYVKEEE